MKIGIKNCTQKLTKISWLPPLLARIVVGIVFVESGWGKLHNIENVVGYFTELGIPFASVQAPFVAGVEFIAGLLLIVGLATRIASVPLIGVMVVAIITAKMSEISTISDLFGFSEFLYILLLFWILIAGPGAISADQIIHKKVRSKI